MKALRKYLLAALALCAGAGIVLFPGELSEAVRGSVGGCLEVVIPALFAFTVLAVYLQRSGLYRVVLKPLTVPLSKLLRLPEELCAVFLLSNIGGYPVGAKLLSRACQVGEAPARGRLAAALLLLRQRAFLRYRHSRNAGVWKLAAWRAA